VPLSDRATVAFRRARFGTRLPVDCLYTRSHYWLLEAEAGVWNIGFTSFATRMLGDIVEFQFDVEPGSPVALGQRIGWIEGFKAVSDVYSVSEGVFSAVNPALREDITLVESDPYEDGWLYRVAGRPGPEAVDVNEYVAMLDASIEKMLSERYEGGEV